MANIDPIRRAEIGREKRARTRAQLLAAANALFARQAVESVTVDDVVREAGVAKGTFYVHFKDLPDLTAAVADELVKEIDDLLQPIRLTIDDPALRIAYGCSCFLDRALADPGWAGVAARMAAAATSVGTVARRRLLEDIKRNTKSLRQGGAVSAELALEVVVGIMLQMFAAIAEGRLSSRHREGAIAAILRAIGLDARQVKSVLARLPVQTDAARTGLPGKAATARRRTIGGAV
ncbi:TetR/AcrR family transcriptional regulator [Bradyrhizobium manausense]|uniref:TetR/AcrR family transcriptional regulator n=1 Tax=Bradyrhizobium TaxID=374 RepID=UPI001BAE043C|nr:MULTISPECIES: TetR/AcrR family transcriptional regulator [Bradyrhizobium]MBR0825683.1 TetR/AcrR family transcriptional regulator [Bradyrhizobium manausense]UVO31367.1 TetR/AcrR family transcriptional regulator [Bradyrhizobium arachidis]